MADFVSTQTGVLNDGAQWGLISPGVKGVDWPGNAGDTFTVSVTHVITYNVSEANEMGTVTVNGTLSFQHDADTLLTFAAASKLTIAATGIVEIGTEANPIADNNTAKILVNSTADNVNLLDTASGMIFRAHGREFVFVDTLADDAENTNGDVWIKTVSDMSSEWLVGDTITINHKKQSTGATWVNDTIQAVIASFGAGNTIELDVTVTADAGVGSTWTARVVNVTRNITLGKVGASEVKGNYNTNRPNFAFGSYQFDADCYLKYVQYVGVYNSGFYGATPPGVTEGLVTKNSRLPWSSYATDLVDCIAYSSEYGFYSLSIYTSLTGCYGICCDNGGARSIQAGCQLDDCYFFGNATGINYGIDLGSVNNVKIYCNSIGVANSRRWNNVKDLYIFGNNNGIHSINNLTIPMRNVYLGVDENGNEVPNVAYDYRFQDTFFLNKISNLIFPVAGLVLSGRTLAECLSIEGYGGVEGANIKILAGMDVVKVSADGGGDRPSVDPDGGNGSLVELSNLQSFLAYRLMLAFEHRIWAEASVQKTYRYYVQTTFAGITAGNLKLIGSYLDEAATSSHIAETTHAPAINERGDATDWTQYLEVTITPAQAGWVTLTIWLKEYQAGDEVWIYPLCSIS